MLLYQHGFTSFSDKFWSHLQSIPNRFFHQLFIQYLSLNCNINTLFHLYARKIGMGTHLQMFVDVKLTLIIHDDCIWFCYTFQCFLFFILLDWNILFFSLHVVVCGFVLFCFVSLHVFYYFLPPSEHIHARWLRMLTGVTEWVTHPSSLEPILFKSLSMAITSGHVFYFTFYVCFYVYFYVCDILILLLLNYRPDKNPI